MITLLDYGAGNVRSVINAIEKLGETVAVAASGRDILDAQKLVFPGVGNFGSMMSILRQKQFVDPLLAFLNSGRPFLGICVGMQALFEGSEESPDEKGLCFLPGRVKRFTVDLAVPHIGWNGIRVQQPTNLFDGLDGDEKFYFVHSYHAVADDPATVLTTTDYGYPFVSAVQQGRVQGTQFHPEKSSTSGLKLLEHVDLSCSRTRVVLPASPEGVVLEEVPPQARTKRAVPGGRPREAIHKCPAHSHPTLQLRIADCRFRIAEGRRRVKSRGRGIKTAQWCSAWLQRS